MNTIFKNRQCVTIGVAAAFFVAWFASPSVRPQQAGELEEIVVTGSFISRPADRPQPVTVIDTAELAYQNRGSIAEIFKELPQVSGTVSTTNWSEGGDSPTNTINLRGLGARHGPGCAHRVASRQPAHRHGARQGRWCAEEDALALQAWAGGTDRQRSTVDELDPPRRPRACPVSCDR